VKVGVDPDTGLLFTSFNEIVIVDVVVPSATTGPVPTIVEFAATGIPAVKVTVPPIFTIGVAIARVLISALSEDNVHVEIPDASETEHAVTEFVEPVSVAEKVGLNPGVGLFEASLRVIVIVEVAAPSATTGPEPVMEELATTGIPAVNVTVPPIFTPGVAMERVLTSAIVDFKVQVETPEAFEEVQTV
jgi:hypothetical protein